VRDILLQNECGAEIEYAHHKNNEQGQRNGKFDELRSFGAAQQSIQSMDDRGYKRT